MNYIGLDISLNSTAVFIENDINKKILSFTNKNKSNKYIKDLENIGVDFYFIANEKYNSYSDNEILKLFNYDKLSDIIVDNIKKYLKNEKTLCLCEGYSFSKNTSSILDIVSLSTMIKIKLLKNIKDFELAIISPASLKKEAGGLAYGFDKKGMAYNSNGLSSGKFTKSDMFKALIDSNLSTPITDYLIKNENLIKRKKIPNPIEDIIDSIFACKIKINEYE